MEYITYAVVFVIGVLAGSGRIGRLMNHPKFPHRHYAKPGPFGRRLYPVECERCGKLVYDPWTPPQK